MSVLAHERPAPAGVEAAVGTARAAAASWARVPLRRRLAVVRAGRRELARRGIEVARSATGPGGRAVHDVLTSEVVPLADAMRFIERSAARVLRSRRVGRLGRPLWLLGVTAVVRRVPRGVVLIVGPSNYPLLLPGVQALHAIAAGNAAVVKPGAGGAEAAAAFAALFRAAGLPAGVLTVLDEPADDARRAIDAGVDHVVLTGSTDTGRDVLARLARTVTPAAVELGGCDAAFVRRDADLELAARALAFGVRLNGGATCIAPRRVLVAAGVAGDLERRLLGALRDAPPVHVAAATVGRVSELVDDALAGGARLAVGERPAGDRMRPLVLAGVRPGMAVARSDVFAPVLALIETDDDDDALRADASCPYALGASVFGRTDGAVALAGRVRAGVVTVNDLIVPTADPRLPFGGRGASGFGVTRGEEGLLDMTVPRTIAVRGGRTRPHYDEPPADAAGLFDGYLRMAHGAGLLERWRGLRAMVRAARGARRGETT